MMSHGFRPPGKLNEVNVRTFTSPEALKAVKIFTDPKAFMVYGVLYEPALYFCNVR